VRKQWTALLLSAGMLIEAREPKEITATWSQLPAVVEGRKLTVGLKSGRSIQGALAGHDANGLTIDQGGKRGSQTVSRQDITRILAARKKRGTRGRAIGTAAGIVGAGVLAGTANRSLGRKDRADNGSGALVAVLVVILGAGAVALGYSLGNQMDGSPARIQIPDLVP
jgi:hypothetical protein